MHPEYMFALGAPDLDTLISDPGIVKPEPGLTFFALDDHLLLLDDGSLWWKSLELSETTLVLYQKG
jgi:hypothetical protein